MFFTIPKTADLAIITKGKNYTYEELQQEANAYRFNSPQKAIVLILCRNTVATVSAYISALQQRHAVMLLDATMNEELLQQIITQYQPSFIVGAEAQEGYERSGNLLLNTMPNATVIHEDLAILLSTSGTTGSPKFVRLSYNNVQSNAQSIVEYLAITNKERAIANLPMSYSYGMSIINSHLQAGATLVLSEQSVMEKDFWAFVKDVQATSLAGVPFTYQMLQRIGFMKMDLPHLTTLTQAGGRLSEKLVKAFATYAQDNAKQFYVMYGQTEAAPRMSYIPPQQALAKAGTIGIAVPQGELSIAEESGELIYKGANVMLGYAESLADLAKGDELHGVLHTGDTAKQDEDGYFAITGRLKRFIKLFGLRINLDDVERKLESRVQQAVICAGNDDKLLIVVENEALVDTLKKAVEELYHLHHTAYKIKVLEQIPRFANGKVNYSAL